MERYVIYYDGKVDIRRIEICKNKREARKFVRSARKKNGNRKSDYVIVNFGKTLPGR